MPDMGALRKVVEIRKPGVALFTAEILGARKTGGTMFCVLVFMAMQFEPECPREAKALRAWWKERFPQDRVSVATMQKTLDWLFAHDLDGMLRSAIGERTRLIMAGEI